MEQLNESIKGFSDEQLLDQYLHHQDEYIPDAITLMKEEIEKRKLSIESLEKSNQIGSIKKQLSKEEFTPFDHIFNNIDIELAATVLIEQKIPFFVDNPQSSDTVPLEPLAEKQFTIHVHKESVEKAHELLDEHFEKIGGKYQMKKMSIKDQLKSLSFTGLRMSEQEAMETANVVLTPEEKQLIIQYGQRLIEEVDTIEREQERVVFYYDSIEELLKHLGNKGELQLTKTELVTILEILQIYCNEEDFPLFIEESIASLLSFFQD